MTTLAARAQSASSRSARAADGLLLQVAAQSAGAATAPSVLGRRFSVLARPAPKYPGHIPLTTVERAALAAGSGLLSFLDPRRADLIAALSETTSTPFPLPRLRDAMLAHPTGRRLLRDRPRMTSASLDLARLRALPEGTLGATYAAWLAREGVSPDTRAAVRFVDDAELAYVLQRYRESHDFYHALLGLPVFRESELALKAFEFANTGLPMAGLSVLAAVTLRSRRERERFWTVYFPWAVRNGARAASLLNVYWEEEMERDVDELRAELGVEKPPDLREVRRRERDERRRREAERSAEGGSMTGGD